MCDTQIWIDGGRVWFAKNSDREPSEPQPVVRYPAVRDDSAPRVRVSHIEIEQIPDRHATILSQPAWCWGAEMGINDAGVAIGNEAIFSRQATLEPAALLGMDLVRLGLERASTAAQAVDVMTALLERYGQGGPAGYQDRRFCYDSSFIVADSGGGWVLETAGRSWAAKRIESRAAISNALTLGDDYERCSDDLRDARPPFARRFDTHLMPLFARSHARRALAIRCLQRPGSAGWARMAAHLRTHAHDRENPARGSNSDICMHAAGFVRRHQTTGSMLARLSAEGVEALFTGTSAPCLSIFRPAGFVDDWSVLTAEAVRIEAPLWRRHEWLHRWALADRGLRDRLRATRDEVERQMFALLDAAVVDDDARRRADRLAAAWHKVLWESLAALPAPRLPQHWRALSARDGIDPARAQV